MIMLKVSILLGFFVQWIFAQNSTYPRANTTLGIYLFRCTNDLKSYGGQLTDPHGDADRAWNLVWLYDKAASISQYSSGSGSYVSYTNPNYTAFFWNDKGPPRGLVEVKIPETALKKKTGVYVGSVLFEGQEFPCSREFGGSSTGGVPHDGGCNGSPFCAAYTHCFTRYACNSWDLPEDRQCLGPDGKGSNPNDYCWPTWTE